MQQQHGEQMQQQQQQPRHRNRGVINLTSKPLFFVALLLVGVLMSVSNIRHAITIVPEAHNDESFGTHPDGMMLIDSKRRPSLSSSAHRLESSQNTNDIDKNINTNDEEKLQETIKETIISREILEDLPTSNSIIDKNDENESQDIATEMTRNTDTAEDLHTNDSSVVLNNAIHNSDDNEFQETVTETITNKDTKEDLSTTKFDTTEIITATATATATVVATVADTGTTDIPSPTSSTPVSSSSSSSSLSVTPNGNNTVISLVSMGQLVDTFLVERCIRSIRRRGIFSGTIMVFTDAIGYERYQKSILPWDDRTKIIQGHDEDMIPREEEEIIEENSAEQDTNNKTNPQLKRKYAQATMVFKRFKTHHSKYIAEDPVMQSIRYVMYIDVDNIIGDRLDTFFQDYTNMVAGEYQRATDEYQKWKLNLTTTVGNGDEIAADTNNNSDHVDFSFVSMFRDKHLRGKMHSGVIIYDLSFEERCVNGWRNEMDTFWHASDQTMFIRVLENYDRYRCVAFALPQQNMAFANKRLMTDAAEERNKKGQKKKPLTLPTFMRVTSNRVKRIKNTTIHEDFLRYALDLKDNETITDDISWEDVVSRSGKRTTEG